MLALGVQPQLLAGALLRGAALGLLSPALQRRGVSERDLVLSATSKLGGQTGIVDKRVCGASSSDGIFPPLHLDLPFLLFPLSTACWWEQRERVL